MKRKRSEYEGRHHREPNPQIRRLNNLLDGLSERVKSKFQCDPTGLVSMTSQKVAKVINDTLLLLPDINADSVVTDAMAGCGGDTIAFASAFSIVFACEPDYTRFCMLEHNLRISELSNVVLFRGHYQTVMERFKQDIIFLDPPWGANYERTATGELKIDVARGERSTEPFENLIRRAAKLARYVVLKLPHNYDTFHLFSRIEPILSEQSRLTFGPPSSMCILIMKSVVASH